MARVEFPEKIKRAALRRSGGRCECTRKSCKHSKFINGRCTRGAIKALASQDVHFHHVGRSDDASLKNCKVLCVDCHKQTPSYGKNK